MRHERVIKKYMNPLSKYLSETPTLVSYPQRKCKGKAIPLQAWTGPQDSRRLRLPDFKTIGT
jgi:hypothetical protein